MKEYAWDKMAAAIIDKQYKLRKNELADYVDKLMAQNKLDHKDNYIIDIKQYYARLVPTLEVNNGIYILVRFRDKRTEIK